MKQRILLYYKLGSSYLLQNKTIKQTLLKNTFWLLFGESLAKFILFLNVVIVTRYLGVEKYGILSFAFAFTALFGIIVDFGFNNYITREISRDTLSARKHIDNLLIIKFILSLISFGLVIIFIQQLHKDKYIDMLVYGSAVYTILQSFITFFQTVFQSFEKMQHVFISRILYTLSLFIIILFIVFKKLSVQSIVNGYIFASLIALAAVIFLTKKYFTNFFVEFDYPYLVKVIYESWPFFAGVVCVTVYVNLDTTLISIFRNYSEVGLYQSVDKVLSAFLTLTLVHQALLPTLSSLYGKGKLNSYVDLMKMTFKYSVIILIPLGLLLSIFSKEILFILYGNAFISASTALTALIWTGILVYFSSFWGNTLMIINKQKQWFFAVLIGALANIVLNLIFIPLYGYIAASFITTVCEFLILIISYFMCPKYLRNFFVQ